MMQDITVKAFHAKIWVKKSFRLFRHGAGQVWEERHHSQRLPFVTWSLSKAFEDLKESIVHLQN